MSQWRKQAVTGLKAGDYFEYSRTFSLDDTEAFGDMTRDYNPVHYEERFAKHKGFNGLVCHGLLVGAMICEMGGQVAWLASKMNFSFLKPTYFGDTITCRVTVLSIDERGRAQAKAEFLNQHGEQVISAELGGVLPNEAERGILADMLAVGDPTNKLAE